MTDEKTNQRYVVIKSCAECPHCRDTDDNFDPGYDCVYTRKDALIKHKGHSRRIPLYEFPKIPNWCPLPPASSGKYIEGTVFHTPFESDWFVGEYIPGGFSDRFGSFIRTFDGKRIRLTITEIQQQEQE